MIPTTAINIKKRPLVPKLKLRSRTPISLHVKDPKADIKERTLLLIQPGDEVKEVLE